MYMVPKNSGQAQPDAVERMCGGPWLRKTRSPKRRSTHIRARRQYAARRRQPAWRSSLKKRKPKECREAVRFQSGKAMLKRCRDRKIVSVLPPPKGIGKECPMISERAANIGADGRSSQDQRGRLQRARKTPMTMMSEMTIGEMPMETSFVGVRRPSQAPQRSRKGCRAVEAFSHARRLEWGILLQSKSANKSRRSKPIRTATGTQKWMSVRIVVHSRVRSVRFDCAHLSSFMNSKHKELY